MAVTLSALMMLSACGASGGSAVSTGPDRSLTPGEAKKIAQQTESDIVALIPSQNVAVTQQSPQGILMSCDTKGSAQWSGWTTVTLRGNSDAAAIVSAIAEDYDKREGFSTRDASTYADRTVQIIGAHSAGYLVGPWNKGAEIRIDSFSPCFLLPDGLSVGDSY